MSSLHEDINCDTCCQQDIPGTRYSCLICENYDQCESCHQRGESTKGHTPSHPTQAILTQRDLVLKYDAVAPDEFSIFRCPYCGNDGFTLTTLLMHVKAMHQECKQYVRCPVCVTFRIGWYRFKLLDCSLATHIKNAHKGFSSDFERKYKLLQYIAFSYSEEVDSRPGSCEK